MQSSAFFFSLNEVVERKLLATSVSLIQILEALVAEQHPHLVNVDFFSIRIHSYHLRWALNFFTLRF